MITFGKYVSVRDEKPVAKVQVEFVVGRDDLCSAACVAIEHAIWDKYNGVVTTQVVDHIAFTLRQSTIEAALRTMLREYGGMVLETTIFDYLNLPSDIVTGNRLEHYIEDVAEDVISRLYPSL